MKGVSGAEGLEPSALRYLISEGFLPEEPAQTLYKQRAYVFRGEGREAEYEVIATERCVVLSQGAFIRNVYKFDLEAEEVASAILTHFSDHASILPNQTGNQDSLREGLDDGNSTAPAMACTAWPVERSTAQTDLALVVLFQSKAHVYFLKGSFHVMDLPFQVQKAFPAPNGFIVQRKRSPVRRLDHTPRAPVAPANSFLAAHARRSSTSMSSPTFVKSFQTSTKSGKANLSVGQKRMDGLVPDMFQSSAQANEEEPAVLYSLTHPLADFGVVTSSSQHRKPRLSWRHQPELHIEFESLDPAEDILYVSAVDELTGVCRAGREQLTVIIAANWDLQSLTFWHAWYIGQKPLASLTKRRAAYKAARLRRRSSFMNNDAVTGTTTPAIRQHEATRFNGLTFGTSRADTEPGSLQRKRVSRKPTREEEEEAMASQMDPDFQPSTSQQTARESRRISSLNADAKLNHSTGPASFGAPGGRRNTSFGGPNERRSAGYRRTRSSASGGVAAYSQHDDSDIMDLDGNMDVDEDRNTDSIVEHIRATYEAAGAQNVLGDTDGGYKKDLVIRKFHTMNMASLRSSETHARDTIDILVQRQSNLSDLAPRLQVFIHDSSSHRLVRLEVLVRRKRLWTSSETSPYVAVPFVLNEMLHGPCAEASSLEDDVTRALAVDLQCLRGSSKDSATASPAAYPAEGPQSHRTFRDRVSPKIDMYRDHHRHHRTLASIQTRDETLERLFLVCDAVLPTVVAQGVRRRSRRACSVLADHPERMQGTDVRLEWVAFVAAILSIAPHLANQGQPPASPAFGTRLTPSGHLDLGLRRLQANIKLARRPAWAWVKHANIERSVGKDQLFVVASSLISEISIDIGPVTEAVHGASDSLLPRLMVAFHIFAEEQKLYFLRSSDRQQHVLAALIAQLGGLLSAKEWSAEGDQYYAQEGGSQEDWLYTQSDADILTPSVPLMSEPVGVLRWFEHTLATNSEDKYPTLADLTVFTGSGPNFPTLLDLSSSITPRVTALSNIVAATGGLGARAATTCEAMVRYGITIGMLESLPEAIAAPFREAIAECATQPPTTWQHPLLELVGREDLDDHLKHADRFVTRAYHKAAQAPKDVHTICGALDHHAHSARTKEADRHDVSQLLFSEDRRLVEAANLMHFHTVQVAECRRQPDWTDAYYFEQQRRVMQWVTTRMIALPIGDALLHYDSQTPLLTDKCHLPGFGSACLMRPTGHTLTVDRGGLTEEKVNWAYFHAGASTGLRISRNVKGIDTSWVAFNKPNELTNRHAGLLLALGLSGHLRQLAKWLSFKYLTPKHTMTSVGLLLGLSASYLGTMDGLITRMLSVHITRMLPLGAAELNVSPITQTAGLVGIGLLYYNTQHRRMSEILLSELEHMALEDPDTGPDTLRDESYRLAAGFALGFINLGKGTDLRGLHGMSILERLLAVAVGPRPVNAVHVFDRATAGAIIAIALVYMKSSDQSVARKIDIPDTQAQFDHVRPDMLMLRVVAKHLILWDSVSTADLGGPARSWIESNLPACYEGRLREINASGGKHPLSSSDVPFFNIATGLAWVLSLKYAGSGNTRVRDEILDFLDSLYGIKGGADAHYYDAKLAKSTLRRCVDVLALSAATVMAGTGDIRTFRYLRRLHGRTDAETPYGSHLAAHLAIGALFLGGGTYTFGTSNLAVASLVCAFYPLFPPDVHDNHVHLQALRHLWVFAAEQRCLVITDVDTQRPIRMPITLTMADGTVEHRVAPCLLPSLDSIASFHTDDPAFWRVTRDFVINPGHLTAFRKYQQISVRRCPASEAHQSAFSSTFVALNDAQSSRTSRQMWRAIFDSPTIKQLDQANMDLILAPDMQSSLYTDARGTVVDDQLSLSKACHSNDKDTLWNLRVLFTWAEKARDQGDGRLRWLGNEVVEDLRARIEERSHAYGTG